MPPASRMAEWLEMAGITDTGSIAVCTKNADAPTNWGYGNAARRSPPAVDGPTNLELLPAAPSPDAATNAFQRPPVPIPVPRVAKPRRSPRGVDNGVGPFDNVPPPSSQTVRGDLNYHHGVLTGEWDEHETRPGNYSQHHNSSQSKFGCVDICKDENF